MSAIGTRLLIAALAMPISAGAEVRLGDQPPTIDPCELKGKSKLRIRNASHQCPGYKKECGKTISSNKNLCKTCADLKAIIIERRPLYSPDNPNRLP